MTELLLNGVAVAVYLAALRWAMRLSRVEGDPAHQLPRLRRAPRFALAAFAVSMLLLLITGATQDLPVAAIWTINLMIAARTVRTLRHIRDTQIGRVETQRQIAQAMRVIEARHAALRRRVVSEPL